MKTPTSFEQWITIDDSDIQIKWELLIRIERDIDKSYGADADGNRGCLVIDYDCEVLEALRNGHRFPATKVPQEIYDQATEKARKQMEGESNGD